MNDLTTVCQKTNSPLAHVWVSDFGSKICSKGNLPGGLVFILEVDLEWVQGVRGGGLSQDQIRNCCQRPRWWIPLGLPDAWLEFGQCLWQDHRSRGVERQERREILWLLNFVLISKFSIQILFSISKFMFQNRKTLVFNQLRSWLDWNFFKPLRLYINCDIDCDKPLKGSKKKMSTDEEKEITASDCINFMMHLKTISFFIWRPNNQNPEDKPPAGVLVPHWLPQLVTRVLAAEVGQTIGTISLLTGVWKGISFCLNTKPLQHVFN